MILSEIRDYIRERKQATIADIAIHFDSDPDTVRGMLEVWINKGQIRKSLLTSDCGTSCNKCNLSDIEIYNWIDQT